METLLQQLFWSIEADQEVRVGPHAHCSGNRLLVGPTEQGQGANGLHKPLVEQDDVTGLIWIPPLTRQPGDVLAQSDQPNGVGGGHQSKEVVRQAQRPGI